MSANRTSGWGSQLAVAGVFAAIGAAALVFFVRFAEPPGRVHREPFRADYDPAPLVQAMAGDGLARYFSTIATASTNSDARWVGRVSGTPGAIATEALIRDAFARSGCDVTTQEFRVVIPVTEQCEARGADGQPLAGVDLYPFIPSGLRPVALPADGLEGELVFVEGASLVNLNGHDPRDTIVLTYLDTCGAWATLASAGVKALIVIEDQDAKQMRASPDTRGVWEGGVSQAETSFPRFFARGRIADYAGRRVRLHARVTWQERTARNVIGRLPGAGRPDEALVLTAYYDSYSLVPELAPGAEQAVGVAALMQMAEALAPYRGRMRRDVVFIATAGHAQAMAGISRIMEAAGRVREMRPPTTIQEERRKTEVQLAGFADTARAIVSDPALWTNPATDRIKARIGSESSDFRTWLDQRVSTVAGEVNLEHREIALTARLSYLRAGSPVFRDGFDAFKATDDQRKDPANRHPLLQAMLDAQQQANVSGNNVALNLALLAAHPEFTEWRYLDRLTKLIDAVIQHHATRIREIDETLALCRLFDSYRHTLTISLELNSGGSKGLRDVAVLGGFGGSIVEPQVTELRNTISDYVPASNSVPRFEIVSWGVKDIAGSKERPSYQVGEGISLQSQPWLLFGRLAFAMVNYRFAPPKLTTPEDTFDGLSLSATREQLACIGPALLSVAFGRLDFKDIPSDQKRRVVAIHGRVVGSAGTGAVVPSHPMGVRTFVGPKGGATQFPLINMRGVSRVPILATDPYGQYERAYGFNFVGNSGWGGFVTADAARFAEDGTIRYFKDSGKAAQGTFRSENFPSYDVRIASSSGPKPINVVLFRCTPVEMLDQGNPKTMKSFLRVDYLRRQGISGPGSFRQIDTTAYLEPDLSFYLALLDGASDNPKIQTYRGFMLNADPAAPVTPGEPELFGRGYLAADTPLIVFPHMDAAESMHRTAGKRLQLQQRHGMADELMMGFHTRGLEWLAKARKALEDRDPLAAQLAAGRSLAYAINNHPVIRQRISDAVIGILWYLGLLVPFVFFFEKLVFGFADIRKQLLASGLIFLAVFALLQFFHPAFQMVRSSIMILIGFIMLLLTLLVTLMVGGKFQQNIKDLRSREGRVEGADINRGGVIGTAFMLGLNNMRRRKVRTGLTSITLVLITFVMICFTSVTSDLVNVEYPTGRSPWNGLELQKRNFVTLTASELGALQQIYGRQFPLSARYWLTARLDATKLQNTEILIDRDYEAGGQKIQKRVRVSASMRMDSQEPQFSGLDRFLRTERRWFPRPPANRQERTAALASGYKETRYVILPDVAARELDITTNDVNAGTATVTIRSEEFSVLGIIDSAALEAYASLDGRSILPYDLNTIQSLGRNAQGGAIVPDDVKRLPASQVIIVNRQPASAADEQELLVACGILFPRQAYRLPPDTRERPAVPFRAQREIVMEYLERVGEGANYAIDGISYYGSRMRAKTFEGLLDLLIPILIAALTVFNTMRGSVYERKDEIYVYNAVGIAPNHVFFMFMAEACVFAVVGAMLGYLLSQATGRLLTALDLTGGMNMNYSSIETIYASLAIVVAVLLSTIMPARSAARLAAPSELREWTVPEAQGDVMSFSLPFTFTPHDRVAVVSYFNRWLDANGEGSSGAFFCAPPRAVVRRDPSEPGGLVPGVVTTVWLKPYDLGVSQRLEVWLPTDPETREFIASVRLVRVSGTSSAWQRTVKPFLGLLRKQFLNWRAATPAERGEMYAEARSLLSRPGAAVDPAQEATEEHAHG